MTFSMWCTVFAFVVALWAVLTFLFRHRLTPKPEPWKLGDSPFTGYSLGEKYIGHMGVIADQSGRPIRTGRVRFPVTKLDLARREVSIYVADEEQWLLFREGFYTHAIFEPEPAVQRLTVHPPGPAVERQP